MDLYDFRRDYLLGGLGRDDLHQSPIDQFKQWLEELLVLETTDPTAMVLATVNSHGQPNQRIVLLKHFDDMGFEFFTNKQSDKGVDIAHNPRVSLHFPRHSVERQVKVSGVVESLSEATEEEYFASRPRESQLAAWASQQSQPVKSRSALMSAYQDAEAAYPEQVPRPQYWGGYRVIPHAIEFWQGGAHRLHDRFAYEKSPQGDWTIQRLSP